MLAPKRGWMSEVKDLQEKFPVVVDEKTGALLWKDLRTLKLQYLIPVSRIRKFLEGLSEGSLYGTRCPSCGAKYFPPRIECSQCGATNLDWVKVSLKGTLLAYTIVNVKPESYQSYQDYPLGIAEMDDGFRVLAWIKCDDPKKIKCGMRVGVEFLKRDEDGLTMYYLKPLED